MSCLLRSNMPIDTPSHPISIPRHPCDTLLISQTQKGEDTVTDKKEITEIDYCDVLNRTLPKEIRVLGWSEVTPEFDARFSAAGRKYRYFFLKKRLDIAAMQHAADLMVGEHDFRNFCKMNIGEVSNFKRRVYSAQILEFSKNTVEPDRSVYMLEIEGVAFLWHMVRCCMAVLSLVGEGKEAPSIVSTLLDIQRVPGKPNYHLAAEEPLVLHACGFDNLHIKWAPKTLWQLTEHYEALYDQHTVAAAQALNCVQFLRTCQIRTADLEKFAEFAKIGSSAAIASALTTQTGMGAVCTDDGALKCEGVTDISDPGIELEPPPKRIRQTSPSRTTTDVAALSAPTPPPSSTVSWGTAVDLMERVCNASYPYPSTGGIIGNSKAQKASNPFRVKYMPLLSRSTAEAYEQRAAQVGGSRKERLQRHLDMQETNARDGQQFFAHFRAQGSL